MKYLNIFFAVAVAVLALSGCASKSVQNIDRISTAPGSTGTAIMGAPFLTYEKGKIEHSEQWQGVAFGGMHRSTYRSPGYRKTELYYGGIDDGIVTIQAVTYMGEDSTPRRETASINTETHSELEIAGIGLVIFDAKANRMSYSVKYKP